VPKLQLSSLIQLLLRSIFGVDARTEILIYLLAHEGGNSNSIAKEIFYNQKNVYTILEKWSHAQMVAKMSGQKIPRYSLNRKKELLHAIGLKEMPDYLNWTRTFLLLATAKAICILWSDDEYLLPFLDSFTKPNHLGDRSVSIFLTQRITRQQFFSICIKCSWYSNNQKEAKNICSTFHF
jgi:hypothetical protein